MIVCPLCTQENPEGFRFCGACGALLGDATPAREERKVITALFCDQVGSTAQGERLDPEDLQALLSRYHAHVRTELERFGGTVEKFIGDAVVALFGAPLAHEDDPERAVRAALAIKEWVSKQADFHVRIAVTTGEALVVLGARAAQGEHLASGDVLNTAARLQAAAPIDGILVGEQTFRATERVVQYREHQPVPAKGKAEPVPVWEAVQARAVAVALPHTAPLVGREREVALLRGALDRSRAERSAQLVTVVGTPGIGKSRLVLELARAAAADPEPIVWRQGRCLPYGDGVTFWALGEIVKAQVGILASDPPQEAKRKLSRAAGDRWVESHLRPLIGLSGEPELRGDDRRGEAFAAWRQFFEGVAEQGPLVLVAEDLHWSDDEFLDFIDHLVEWASGVPMLVVCTARPELWARRPAWGGGKPNAVTISLSSLSNEETARLLGQLLQRSAPSAETQSALLARAGGNPLYAEQYARILLERGEMAELPATVQGIVAARLDLLGPDEKMLLQDAAVLGKAFTIGGLAWVAGLEPHVVNERLHALERKEFFRRERRSAPVDDTQYSFLHILVRDVAYRQIPRAPRAEKHRRAAEWLESLGRAEDHAEMLAHHYLQALELAEASGVDAGALIEPARRALRNAGDRAAALYAVEAAERFYDAALRLSPEQGRERAELLLRRAAPVRQFAGGGDTERLVEARDALLAVGDNTKAAEAQMLLAETLRMQGHGELSNELADGAVALLADAPPSESSVWVLVRGALRADLAGEYERALEIGSRGYALAEELGWDEGLSESLSELGMARVGAGDPGGVADVGRSVQLAARAGALGALARAHNSLSVVHQILGDLDAGYTARLEGARIAERLGSATAIRFFQGVLASFQYRRGNWDEARLMANDFIAAVEAGPPHYIAWQVFADRAEMRSGAGDSAGAMVDADRALAAGRAANEPWPLYFVLAASAHVLAGYSARHEQATELSQEFLHMLGRGVPMNFAAMNLPVFATAAMSLGLANALVDKLEGHLTTPWTDAARAYAHRDFIAAAEILRQTGSRTHEAEARLLAAEQLIAGGRRADADEQLRRAIEFYRSVGAIAYVDKGEGLLAASA